MASFTRLLFACELAVRASPTAAQPNLSKCALSHNPIRHSVELEEENTFVVEEKMCSLIGDYLNPEGLLLLAGNVFLY